MNKITLLLSILTFSAVITSCGGPASEATGICECFEKAKKNKDRALYKKCRKQYHDLTKKYKDDDNAIQEIKEVCDIH